MSTTRAQAIEGVVGALGSAALFGLGAPLSKWLLPSTAPVMLAGLLYLGAGLGLVAHRILSGARGPSAEAPLRREDIHAMTAAILAGGIAAPVLMLVGLGRTTGVVGSLLLNLEAPLTIALAVAVFGEHMGWRPIAATVVILAGTVLLSVPGGAMGADVVGALAIGASCLAWALDNNLTQRVSHRDPVAVSRVKALVAGAFNTLLAFGLGQPAPPGARLAAAIAMGVACYGASLVLYVRSLRLLGAARTSAYFATAPFVGALASPLVLGERLGPTELAAMGLMAVGTWLLTREEHAHLHTHEPVEHEHIHVHDEHHRHEHGGPVVEPHTHMHRHERLTHAHPHTADVHHRHPH